MNLEIHHLKLLLTIVEEGSITRAGHRLHLTQSALSHQLRAAEAALGAQLFLRLPNRMVLTPSGEKLLDVARRVLSDLKQAEDEIRQHSMSGGSVLRICTQCYTSYHWLHRALNVFNASFPNVEVRVVLSATPEPVQALLEGRLDVAIISTRPDDHRLLAKRLFRDQLVVVMHKDHPLSHKTHIETSDFVGERLIVCHKSFWKDTILNGLIVPDRVEPGEIQEIELTEAIVETVKAGLGVSILTRWAIQPYLESNRLVVAPLTSEGLWKNWYAVIRHSKFQPPYIPGFVNRIVRASSHCRRRNETTELPA